MNDLLHQLFYVTIPDNGIDHGRYRLSLTKIGSVIQGVGVTCLGVAGSLLAAGYTKTSVWFGGIGAGLTGAGSGLAGIGKRNAMDKK